MTETEGDTLVSHPRVYDSIGVGYRRAREPDPRIAARVCRALEGADRVCNVGAGSGSYEPVEGRLVAVEPSLTMIAQRGSTSEVLRARAESLPFPSGAFDATMAVLTVHHWQDPLEGLAELRRVSDRQVILAFDSSMVDSLWLVRDYLPEIADLESERALPIEAMVEALAPARVETVPVPWDCRDGFQAAYWRRPHRYLEAEVRAAISSFAQLPGGVVSAGLERLRQDLESGVWKARYGDLLVRPEQDFGYRLVIGGGSP